MANATDRAVLVGINSYRLATEAEIAAAQPRLKAENVITPPSRDFQPLEGALNDVTAMRELLIHRYRFSADDILELQNEKATRSSILDTLAGDAFTAVTKFFNASFTVFEKQMQNLRSPVLCCRFHRKESPSKDMLRQIGLAAAVDTGSNEPVDSESLTLRVRPRQKIQGRIYSSFGSR